MNLRLISYTPAPYNNFQLGYALIEVIGEESSATYQVKVALGKKDNMFCMIPSVKINEQWISAYSMGCEELDKQFLNEVRELVKPEVDKEACMAKAAKYYGSNCKLVTQGDPF